MDTICHKDNCRPFIIYSLIYKMNKSKWQADMTCKGIYILSQAGKYVSSSLDLQCDWDQFWLMVIFIAEYFVDTDNVILL